jgi:hypothetical protein
MVHLDQQYHHRSIWYAILSALVLFVCASEAASPKYKLHIWSSLSHDGLTYSGSVFEPETTLATHTIYLKQSTGKLRDVLRAERSTRSDIELSITFEFEEENKLLAKVSLTHAKAEDRFYDEVKVIPDSRNQYHYPLKDKDYFNFYIELTRIYSEKDLCEKFKERGFTLDQLPEICR